MMTKSLTPKVSTVGLHEATGVVRFYEAPCPWCEDEMRLDDTTFTDAYTGDTYHQECWDDLQMDRREEYGEGRDAY